MMDKVEPGKFNLNAAMKGYALNMMCHTLNRAENRAAFLADEAGYCSRYDLSAEEIDAVTNRDKPRLFTLGGNMYFLAKLDRVKKAGVK
ncbi:MAG: hypothetical protein EOP62_08990 [Sphingomonadales bacterium]|nr:MAG: hypothetical protein EOP62_08990 [Sphingomonadales bacterium]